MISHLSWEQDLPTNQYILTTSTTPRWISHNTYDSIGNYEPIRYFNCKRCGAVGQSGVCEYCGSAEE